jgi:hypothetical protein
MRQKAARAGGFKSIYGDGLFGCRFASGLGGGALTFEVSQAAFAFDRLVELFAHISLYFAFVIRFCVVTMVSRTFRFNIYYLLVAATILAWTGCQTPESKRVKQIAAVRVHLEANPGPPGRNQQISVLRSTPMRIEIERNPFLNEIHLASAELKDTPGGFAITLRLNDKGRWLLEQYTATNPNKRLLIWSQFGVEPEVKDRWLAAPLITRPIKDGLLTFTPDASRDEAEQIVIGLNNSADAPIPPNLKEKPVK